MVPRFLQHIGVSEKCSDVDCGVKLNVGALRRMAKKQACGNAIYMNPLYLIA